MLADKYVARVLRDVMRPHFDRIVAAFEHHRQQVRAAFATVIQKYVRRHFYRHLLDKLRDDEQHALWLKGRALHAGYKYVTDPEQQRQAYTVNDSDYFMTVCEIRRWFRTRQVGNGRPLQRPHPPLLTTTDDADLFCCCIPLPSSALIF